jgi:outer membrane protein OmpA-like peptidoglycan-associated protein
MRPATFSAFAALAVGAGAGASQALAEESASDSGQRKGAGLRTNAPTSHAWLRSNPDDGYRASEDMPEHAESTANENGGALLTTDELAGTSQASTGGDANRRLRVPVATAFAASLTASQETCMGSRSFGIQAVGFGLSIATTWGDRQCRRIRNARALNDFGYRSAAVALLCQDEEVFAAMERAGTPCPGSQLLSFPQPPVQAPEPEPAAEPPLMRIENVLFDFDRANLRPEADAILAPVLEMLQRDPTLSVDIEGHADWMGSDAYNIRLSQRRAQAVVDWLVARGIARERLHAVGKGEREPIASNETAEGRQLNRRVEVRRR